MSSISNIALELVQLCEILRVEGPKSENEHATKVLNKIFGISKAADLFEVVGVIYKNIEIARTQILSIAPDPIENVSALNALANLESAFGPASLARPWAQAAKAHYSDEKYAPLRSIPPSLRREFPTIRLSDQEKDLIHGEAENLLNWLESHQLTDFSVQRMLMVQGLRDFKRRLDWYKWVGFEYTFEPLLAVLASASSIEASDIKTEEKTEFLKAIQNFWDHVGPTLQTTAKAISTTKTFAEAFKSLGSLLHSTGVADQIQQITHEGVKLLQHLPDK